MYSTKLKFFTVIGVSYIKADESIRGDFSLGNAQKTALYQEAFTKGIEGLIIISTCNRTELYGLFDSPNELISLLCKHSNGSIDQFVDVGYTFKGTKAIEHLLRVGSGLESQILGDFEIIGQLKNSAQESKRNNLLNSFLERLINNVLQTSKRVKNETRLCTGATSVSFAAVQYILENVEEVEIKNILLFGAGKIGRNTCENLVKHSKNEFITIINRNQDKAEIVANKYKVRVKPFDKLKEELSQSDIVIVATGADAPTINADKLPKNKELLIIDLSIPMNVAPNVDELPQVKVLHLDHLSKITDHTLERRKLEIPLAENIIREQYDEFICWIENRKYVPTIKALREKLEEFKVTEIEMSKRKYGVFDEKVAEHLSNKLIQRITNHFAHHLKEDGTSKVESLELIKKIFQLETSKHVE